MLMTGAETDENWKKYTEEKRNKYLFTLRSKMCPTFSYDDHAVSFNSLQISQAFNKFGFQFLSFAFLVGVLPPEALSK